jgi:hypothetical protein
MNINDMKFQNTFRPTQYSSEGTIFRGFFPSLLWNDFIKCEHGTIVGVKNIHSHLSTNVNKLADSIWCAINTCYTDIKCRLLIHTDIKKNNYKEVIFIDPFYNNSPENLAYFSNTTLLIYEDGTIYEKLESKRHRGNVEITGTLDNPIYYQINPFTDQSPKRHPYNNEHVLLKGIPEKGKDDKFDIIKIKFCYLTENTYEKEGKDDIVLKTMGSRRGFYIRRDKRMVAYAKTLGEKLDDHYNRFRMEIIYPPSLDLEFSCRTQKQLSDTLNSINISDALRIIWKQQTSKIINDLSMQYSYEHSTVSAALPHTIRI